jgi:hypothetical protein
MIQEEFLEKKYFFSILFRKLNIMLNNFIFPNLFRTFIAFSLFLSLVLDLFKDL